MQIRTMRHSDVEFAFECTNSEGWLSETRETFKAFLEYDADGCFLAEEKGRNTGICIATKYSHNGFIGELVVIKDMRGKGYGKKLFEHSIRYLHERNIQNIFLEGDLGAVHIYEKAGFRKVCKSLRFVGKIEGESCNSVQPVTPEDIDAICKIDNKLFGDDRSFFLKYRFSLFPELFHVAKMDDEICGYILGHPGNGLLSVGPWAVINKAVSPLTLLKNLSHEVGDELLRVGVLENDPEAVKLMRSISTFKETEYCWRMVLGPSDKLGMSENLYAIGSAAKG